MCVQLLVLFACLRPPRAHTIELEVVSSQAHPLDARLAAATCALASPWLRARRPCAAIPLVYVAGRIIEAMASVGTKASPRGAGVQRREPALRGSPFEWQAFLAAFYLHGGRDAPRTSGATTCVARVSFQHSMPFRRSMTAKSQSCGRWSGWSMAHWRNARCNVPTAFACGFGP